MWEQHIFFLLLHEYVLEFLLLEYLLTVLGWMVLPHPKQLGTQVAIELSSFQDLFVLLAPLEFIQVLQPLLQDLGTG